MRILAIGAHPDDVDFGCAGYLQRGDERHIFIASDGSCGGHGPERLGEAQRSAAVLGASLTVAGLPDTRVDGVALIPHLERLVTVYRPHVVLTMPAGDPHQDHAAVHLATVRALRDYPCTMLAYPTPSAAATFRPNWFARLTALELEGKLKALACHASQVAAHPYLADDYVVGMARYWALVTRSPGAYVEPYELVRRCE